MIYFIQGKATQFIKIGYTSSMGPEERMNNLQCGSPDMLICLATTAGDKSTELSLHKRFKDSWHHGEWFSPTPDLLDYITSLPKTVYTNWQPSLSAPYFVTPKHLEELDSEHRVWI